MAEEKQPHPSPDVLAGFALGRLDEDQIAVVASHLSDCGKCRATVTNTTDSFLDLLRPDVPSPVDGHPIPDALRNHCRYRIIRAIARGGMGTVYLAEHLMLEQLRAIKIINPSLIGNSRAVERFVREADVLSRLHHPNIVQAYDAEMSGGHCLLVMEYVEGETLAKVVERQGPLPVNIACDYARQVAVGLQYAHEQGLVHRDIKPANLMLAGGGLIKILDFGLSRLVSESQAAPGLTHEYATIGTPDYSAPEQVLDARHADICADIYSLGCTLFFLLTGKPPFQKPSAVAVSAAHLHEVPPSLRELRSDTPAGLGDLVLRMLSKLPGQRPQTPAEVVACLAPFIVPEKAPAETLNDATHLSSSPAHRPALQESGQTRLAILAWGKHRLRSVCIAVGLLSAAVLIVWASASLRPQTPCGTVVLEELPEDAEVFVDGVVVALPDRNGKAAEISLSVGQKHQLQVRKNGFKPFGKELEVARGDRPVITVRLETESPSGNSRSGETGKGFVPLFNGKDTVGWSLEGPHTVDLSIENGVLSCRNTGTVGNINHLVTNRSDYTDYQLRCDVMGTGNTSLIASLLLRVDPSPVVFGGMRGYRIKIYPPEATSKDNLQGGIFVGLSARVRAPLIMKRAELGMTTGRWYGLDIRVEGDHITVKIDNVLVLDYRDEGRTFRQGAIALELFACSNTHYRNIAIKELTPLHLPNDGPRDRWVHRSRIGNEYNERWGVYQHTKDKEWIESVTALGGFQRFKHTEVNRTEEYIELERTDGAGTNVTRLFNDHVETGPSRDSLKRGYVGRWEK